MTIAQWILAPIFLHVVLILVVAIFGLRARIAAVMSGKTTLKAIALDNSAWPEEARKLGNNLNNQFEFPTLWYAVCGLLLVTGKADWVGVVLSWLYLILRIFHSVVHTGSNHVPLRMRLFLASVAVVMAMWMWFAIRFYVIG
ncbi:MAG: MAPEG family protein [Alphaproteobacteria bacterium]|nr:MAPEG family protein [Alphaproteobacteria bacterium]